MARVVVTHSDSHPVLIDRFRERLPADYEVVPVEMPAGRMTAPPDEALRDAVADAEALFCRSGLVDADLLDAGDLRIVSVHGSGTEHVDVAAATERGVVVTHNPEAVAPGVVEYVAGAAVGLLRDWPGVPNRTAAGEWNKAGATLGEVGERTVGVLGLGEIGFRVARLLGDGFGAEVLGCDPAVAGETDHDVYPRHDRAEVEAAGVEVVGHDALFERSDLVTVHVPLTDETRRLVGEADLRALDGHLINTARGPVVDEDALLRALEDGSVTGAALDVRADEPPAEDDPIAAHPRTLVTPHVAGPTEGYLRRAAERSAAKVATCLADERPAYVVNPAVYDG
ncbi:MAG: NAD(P)-dependent oxidoreductase [Haloferacaceae archaeon]